MNCLIALVDPKLVDPLNRGDGSALNTEVFYLEKDLHDVEGMESVRLERYSEILGNSRTEVGVIFSISSDKLPSVVKRLRDRLHYTPLRTRFDFKVEDLQVTIRTHQADDLQGLMSLVETGLLFDPDRTYLGEVEHYSRTQGELNDAELGTLDLHRQTLGISKEQAEQLNRRTTGPYSTQASKRDYFKNIVHAEFGCLRAAANDFASKDYALWPLLQELAESLGLPTAEAQLVYQENKQRYQDELVFAQEQAAEQERQDAAANAEADRQKQAQQAQEQRNHYRGLCQTAMATSLYPTEYDQGRLDQARRLRGIPLPEAVQIETAVRDELHGAIESAVGVDYRRLRALLHQQDWQGADAETEAAILRALNQDMQPLTIETLPLLPTVDVVTIDALWSRYSGGRFGFRSQQQVYRHQEQIQSDETRRWREFQIELGWREPSTWWFRGLIPYYELNFSLEAPPGHLPTWRWCCPSLAPRYELELELMAAVMAHLTQAMPESPTLLGVGGNPFAAGN